MRSRLTRGLGLYLFLTVILIVYLTSLYGAQNTSLSHYNSQVLSIIDVQNHEVDTSNQTEVKHMLSTQKVSYSHGQENTLSHGSVVLYNFEPYSGKYFEDACQRAERQVLECSQCVSRPLTPAEFSGEDILFTVRTTVKYHAARLPEILETWLGGVDPASVYVVSDGKDEDLEEKLGLLGNYSNFSFCACGGYNPHNPKGFTDAFPRYLIMPYSTIIIN